MGFEVGWLTFWTRVLSAAANLNVFVLYLGELLPGVRAGAPRAAVMAMVVGLITVVNVIGVRQATWAVDAFTLAQLSPLVLQVLVGVGRVSGDVLASQTVVAPDWTQALLLLVFAQVFTTVYDYVPGVGPWFRDRFWLVGLSAGEGAVLPVLLITRAAVGSLMLEKLSSAWQWLVGTMAWYLYRLQQCWRDVHRLPGWLASTADCLPCSE